MCSGSTVWRTHWLMDTLPRTSFEMFGKYMLLKNLYLSQRLGENRLIWRKKNCFNFRGACRKNRWRLGILTKEGVFIKIDQTIQSGIKTPKIGSEHRNRVKTLGSSRLVQIPNFDPKKNPQASFLYQAAAAIKSSLYSLNIFRSSFWSHSWKKAGSRDPGSRTFFGPN